MDYRRQQSSSLPGSNLGRYEGPEWESSFADILNRTRQNINRISNRYTPGGIDHAGLMPQTRQSASSLGNYSQPNRNDYLQPYNLSSSYDSQSNLNQSPNEGTRSYSVPYIPSSNENFPITTGNESHSRDQNFLLPPPPPQQPTTSQNMTPSQLTQPNTILEAILNRLSAVENQQMTLNQNNSNNAADNNRVMFLENTVENLRKMVEGLSTELRDSNRNYANLQHQISRQTTTTEAIQLELDARRVVITKLDSWTRQSEGWREELETQIAGLMKQIRTTDRFNKEQQESLGDRATKADLEALRDRLHIMTQQAVSASVSAWHEKLETNIRMLERQMAAFRMGTTAGSAVDRNLSQEELHEMLSQQWQTQTPSELLVKGMVAAECRELEVAVEEKIEARVRAAMRGEVAGVERGIRTELREYVGKIAAELGIVAKEGEATSIAEKAVQAKRSMEREMEGLAVKVEELSDIMVAVQDETKTAENNIRREFERLERKFDETIGISHGHVTSVQERALTLENMVRGVEGTQRDWHRSFRDEMTERLREQSAAWTNERVELDRRMHLTEKVVQGVADKVNMSRDVVDGYFSSSPDIRKFQSAVVKVEGLQVEFASIRQELREMSLAVNKLDSGSTKRDDLQEIRERLAGIEPIASQIDTVVSNQHKADSEVSQLKGLVSSFEGDVTKVRNDFKLMGERITQNETTIAHTRGTVTQLSDNLKSALERFGQSEDAMHTQIGKVDGIVKITAAQMADVEGRVRAVDESSSQVREKVASVVARLSIVEASLPQTAATVDSLVTQMAEVQSSVRRDRERSGEQLQTLTQKLAILEQNSLPGGHRSNATVSKAEMDNLLLVTERNTTRISDLDKAISDINKGLFSVESRLNAGSSLSTTNTSSSAVTAEDSTSMAGKSAVKMGGLSASASTTGRSVSPARAILRTPFPTFTTGLSRTTTGPTTSGILSTVTSTTEKPKELQQQADVTKEPDRDIKQPEEITRRNIENKSEEKLTVGVGAVSKDLSHQSSELGTDTMSATPAAGTRAVSVGAINTRFTSPVRLSGPQLSNIRSFSPKSLSVPSATNNNTNNNTNTNPSTTTSTTAAEIVQNIDIPVTTFSTTDSSNEKKPNIPDKMSVIPDVIGLEPVVSQQSQGLEDSWDNDTPVSDAGSSFRVSERVNLVEKPAVASSSIDNRNELDISAVELDVDVDDELELKNVEKIDMRVSDEISLEVDVASSISRDHVVGGGAAAAAAAAGSGASSGGEEAGMGAGPLSRSMSFLGQAKRSPKKKVPTSSDDHDDSDGDSSGAEDVQKDNRARPPLGTSKAATKQQQNRSLFDNKDDSNSGIGPIRGNNKLGTDTEAVDVFSVEDFDESSDSVYIPSLGREQRQETSPTPTSAAPQSQVSIPPLEFRSFLTSESTTTTPAKPEHSSTALSPLSPLAPLTTDRTEEPTKEGGTDMSVDMSGEGLGFGEDSMNSQNTDFADILPVREQPIKRQQQQRQHTDQDVPGAVGDSLFGVDVSDLDDDDEESDWDKDETDSNRRETDDNRRGILQTEDGDDNEEKINFTSPIRQTTANTRTSGSFEEDILKMRKAIIGKPIDDDDTEDANDKTVSPSLPATTSATPTPIDTDKDGATKATSTTSSAPSSSEGSPRADSSTSSAALSMKERLKLRLAAKGVTSAAGTGGSGTGGSSGASTNTSIPSTPRIDEHSSPIAPPTVGQSAPGISEGAVTGQHFSTGLDAKLSARSTSSDEGSPEVMTVGIKAVDRPYSNVEESKKLLEPLKEIDEDEEETATTASTSTTNKSSTPQLSFQPRSSSVTTATTTVSDRKQEANITSGKAPTGSKILESLLESDDDDDGDGESSDSVPPPRRSFQPRAVKESTLQTGGEGKSGERTYSSSTTGTTAGGRRLVGYEEDSDDTSTSGSYIAGRGRGTVTGRGAIREMKSSDHDEIMEFDDFDNSFDS